jgi:hypothetical protein
VRTWVLAAAVLAALVAAGCGDHGQSGAPRAFCDAASRYETELQREQTKGARDPARQLDLVARIAATAPASIRHDARTFLDALRRVDADPRLRDNPAVKRAVDNVNRFASNRCGFFNQQPSGI